MKSNKGAASLYVIIVIVLVALVAGYFAFRNSSAPRSPDQTSSNTTEDWQTYRNDQYEFEFKYPSDVFKDVTVEKNEKSKVEKWILVLETKDAKYETFFPQRNLDGTILGDPNPTSIVDGANIYISASEAWDPPKSSADWLSYTKEIAARMGGENVTTINDRSLSDDYLSKEGKAHLPSDTWIGSWEYWKNINSYNEKNGVQVTLLLSENSTTQEDQTKFKQTFEDIFSTFKFTDNSESDETATDWENSDGTCTRTPKFSDFKTEVFAGEPKLTPVRPDMTEGDYFARDYSIEALKKDIYKGPDFGGHFRTFVQGCGTSCASFGVVDLTTGYIYGMGFGWDGSPEGRPIDYKNDSSLIIEETRKTLNYYEWVGDSKKLLCFDKREVPTTGGATFKYPKGGEVFPLDFIQRIQWEYLVGGDGVTIAFLFLDGVDDPNFSQTVGRIESVVVGNWDQIVPATSFVWNVGNTITLSPGGSGIVVPYSLPVAPNKKYKFTLCFSTEHSATSPGNNCVSSKLFTITSSKVIGHKPLIRSLEQKYGLNVSNGNNYGLSIQIFDDDSNIVFFDIDWGDGSKSNGSTAKNDYTPNLFSGYFEHFYVQGKVYEVVLTITDDKGNETAINLFTDQTGIGRG